jgi:hopanoid C-3 methylase
MNILLIRPHVNLSIARSFQRFLHLEPLDLEIVAGGLPPECNIQILDLTLHRNPKKVLHDTVAKASPDLVGITGYSNQSDSVRDYAVLIKQICPGTTVAVGGIHATIIASDYKSCEAIDAVVRGDGTGPFRALADSIQNGTPVEPTPWLLPLRAPEFDRLAAEAAPAWSGDDLPPRPRRDLIDPSSYFCICPGSAGGGRVKTLFPETATVRTSIGCPYRCNFCVVRTLTGGKYIQRSPEDVVDEIASLKQEYIYFVDDEMFINAARCKQIAELLMERGVKKKYISWARSDTICANVELFRLWKEAGLETLYIGIESLEEANLDFYNKKVDSSVNLKAVGILRELGIGLHAALMVNPDFETEDFLKIRQAIDLLAPAEITFTVFSPSPGTELYDEHQGEYLFENPYLYYDCMHTILPTRLPMKQFYRYFALLYLFAFKKNPWRANGVKAPLRDMLRLFSAGAHCGWALRNIYRAYDKKLW